MKLNKKMVVALALVVCLIATLSMGTLAWFTDDDSVTNDFFVAGSEDNDPDDVFSVDVWEKDEKGTRYDGEDGIDFPAILPGDDLYKEANVENTGAYDQYVRVTVTVSDAHIWQDIFDEVYVPLGKLVTNVNTAFEGWSVEYNADRDELIYVLYYDSILKHEAGQDVVGVFTNVHIPEAMDRYQAAELENFQITVYAEAVQTEHVGNNAKEAFETVGMYIEPGERTIATTAKGLKAALQSGAPEVTLGEAADGAAFTIDYPIANVTIDAEGQNVSFVLTNKAENVVFTNIKDTGVTGVNVSVKNAAAGSSVTIKDSALVSGKGTGNMAIGLGQNCDLVVDNCQFTTDNGNGYAMYNTGACGALTVINCTFTDFANDWVIMTNGTAFGDVTFDNNIFTNCGDGLFKCSVGGGAGNGLQNGDFTFTNNTLTNCVGHDGLEVKLFTSKVTGSVIASGNTRDGADFIPGAAQGIELV